MAIIKKTHSAEIVKRKLTRPLEPWMLPVADKLIRDMMPVSQVAGYLGVSQRTFQVWREKGEDPDNTDELYTEFAILVLKARAEMNKDAVQMLKAHALTDYKALMELLKAADPETWTQQQKIKVEKTSIEHSSRSIDLRRLTDDQLRQYEQLLLATENSTDPGSASVIDVASDEEDP